jgi:hypothetical protein
MKQGPSAPDFTRERAPAVTLSLNHVEARIGRARYTCATLLEPTDTLKRGMATEEARSGKGTRGIG